MIPPRHSGNSFASSNNPLFQSFVTKTIEVGSRKQFCCRFQYFINSWLIDGESPEGIEVLVMKPTLMNMRRIGYFAENNGNLRIPPQWKEVKLTIMEDADFQLVFRAISNPKSWHTTIAIDNIQVQGNDCTTLTPPDFTNNELGYYVESNEDYEGSQRRNKFVFDGEEIIP